MAKQSLHGFGIRLDADEERRKAVAQIVESESSWIIVYQPSFFVLAR